LGVVGSRKITTYGEIITKRLVGRISGKGITIISGFMYGVDAEAHEAAINSGGKTVAVMPCGIDLVHPSYQTSLYKNIIKNNGLIISEYPDSTPPALWTYPRRNRIVAGLSQALLVIEAGIKSGALITAKIARMYNKRIYAVPGPLTSSVSIGTARLIKNGAEIITDVSDILSFYGKANDDQLFSLKEPYGLNRSQKRILEILSKEPLKIDQLARCSGLSISKIGADITVLSLRKYLTMREGKYFLINGGNDVI
ncbi:MAG: DNA-processing protein DprA, partial [Spirochaetales bacterium]|nr:DNA-processing protein DprA [Spirochaetales bacterium]